MDVSKPLIHGGTDVDEPFIRALARLEAGAYTRPLFSSI